MCTVTYLPLEDEGFIITSNRDEAPGRPTLPPEVYDINGQQLLFPKDAFFGGTWICCNGEGRVACLLNGAFTLHVRKLPYRKSRGQVVLESFQFEDLNMMVVDYDFDNIEPFTLVHRTKTLLEEIRWDGDEVHYAQLDINQPHLWASATLYTQEYIKRRHEWFNVWLQNHDTYRAEEILDFHITGGEGDVYNDIVMNRDDRVRTVSITSIVHKAATTDMAYRDLLHETETRRSIG